MLFLNLLVVENAWCKFILLTDFGDAPGTFGIQRAL